MKFVSVLALGFLCTSSSAQKAALHPHCLETARTQAELNACAANEFQRVNRERLRTYRLVMTAVAKDPLASRKVQASERAWISYRNAYLAAMYHLPDTTPNYGSMHPMELDLLVAGLTNDHIRDLKELLENYRPSAR